MAGYPRETKNGSSWGYSDLLAYNIHIRDVTETEYFGSMDFNIPEHMITFSKTSSKASLSRISPDPKYGGKPKVLVLLNLLRAAQNGKEKQVDEFVREYMLQHGFLLPRAKVQLPLLVCGSYAFANPDWSIDGKNHQVHILGENKQAICTTLPEPQLTAEILAADQKNRLLNIGRHKSTLPEDYYAMTFVGLSPTFYRYHIRVDLQQAIIQGNHPKIANFVSRFSPVLPNPGGISDLQNRPIIIRLFEGFRQLAKRF
jgi:hypothetical protein